MGPVLKHQTAAEDKQDNILLIKQKYNNNMNTDTYRSLVMPSCHLMNFNYPAWLSWLLKIKSVKTGTIGGNTEW